MLLILQVLATNTTTTNTRGGIPIWAGEFILNIWLRSGVHLRLKGYNYMKCE